MATLIGSPLLIAATGSVIPLLVIGAVVLASVLYDKWQERQAELRRQRARLDALRESPVGGASARPPAAKPQRSTQSDLESFLEALRGDKPPPQDQQQREAQRERPAEQPASEPDASVTSFQDREQRAAQRRRETPEREQPDARRRRERREALEQRQQKHQATLTEQAEREREQVEERRREAEQYSTLVPAPAPAPEERDRPRPLVADAPTTQRLAAPQAETSLTAQAYHGKLAEILDVDATLKQITDGIRPDELARAIMMAEILGPPLAHRPRSPNFRARRIV